MKASGKQPPNRYMKVSQPVCMNKVLPHDKSFRCDASSKQKHGKKDYSRILKNYQELSNDSGWTIIAASQIFEQLFMKSKASIQLYYPFFCE